MSPSAAVSRVGEERLDQHRQVVDAFAQRRHPDRGHADAIEQILTQPRLRHLSIEVAVRGGDEPDIDFSRRGLTDARDFPLLQDAQQARLHTHRNVANLVEKQRAPLRRFEQRRPGRPPRP